MAVTRARWLIGALIGAASLIVATQALVTYVAERLVVGAVAVVVLMAVTAIGFASLGRARRYIAGELAALGAEPPSGALYGARRAQLVLLRQRSVSPDLDLLADATAAAEAERGYTGRYLVATTVLIGLVGTFGGLMETLARATPLLKGDLASGAGGPTAALGLIAGPLAGLHVTFGTSVVAILVTLALTLVGGDVTLHQERLLALLQERTRHVLVPELWPVNESAAERTVRALQDLRAFVAESLTTSAANSAEKIAGVVRVEVQRMVAQVRTETQTATAAQTAALDRIGVGLTEGLQRTADSVAQELRGAAITSRDAMTQAATASREAMTGAAAMSRDAMTDAAAASRDALTAAAAASREAVDEATTALRETVGEATTASRELVAAAATASREAVTAAAAASREAFESAALATRAEMATAVGALTSTTAQTLESTAASTQAAVASLGELRGSLSAQLQEASQTLATAAAELRAAVGALSPTLSELVPQLGGLTAELALLAARAENPEQPNAVLDELVRLSEDVERLLAAGQPAPETIEAAARETGS
ncbi:MAG: hypothetical protein ACJ8F1_18475 [Polyangia bacterium]